MRGEQEVLITDDAHDRFNPFVSELMFIKFTNILNRSTRLQLKDLYEAGQGLNLCKSTAAEGSSVKKCRAKGTSLRPV